MPTNIRIIHAQDFIIANPEGRLDFEKSTNILIEIASASVTMVDYEIIMDVRKAQVKLSVADLWSLAAELEKFHQPFSRKTAVLCPPEGFDNAGFFALCAKTEASMYSHSHHSKRQSNG